MYLAEIKMEINVADVERADEVLLDLGVGGWSVFEDVVARRAWLAGIFTNEDEARARWDELQPRLTAAGVAMLAPPAHRALVDADWKESYKQHFKAWRFGPLHWVPVWERETFQVPAGEHALWLDPGMAFGTGNHETTRLCCERLVKFAADRGVTGRVIDAGCGSGILALSAASLGFARVTAFDNDPVAVVVSEENAALNGLAGRVGFFVGDLVTGLAGRQAELVLANIQADVLMRFASALCDTVTPGGQLVLSGILERELAQVTEIFAATAPNARLESRVMGEWSDLALTRPV
jgi:ribosomal protein L11 methyltransferase